MRLALGVTRARLFSQLLTESVLLRTLVCMTNAKTKPNPVRAAREAVGLAREKLAARAGLSTSTVYLAERGVLTQATAEKLAPHLGVSAQELQP